LTRQIDKGEMPANLTGAEPKPTHVTEVTPSGIEVLYQWEPKRLYKVRQRPPAREECSKGECEDCPPDSCAADPEWREVPSVTTVLDVLDTPLQWWGQGIGVDGVLKLFQLGLLKWANVGRTTVLVCQEGSDWVVAGQEAVVAMLTKQKLTVNHVKDMASDRGTAVHDALEAWAKTGDRPDPSIYPQEQQHYVKGLRNFIEHANPEPQRSEVMVGSVKYGFAGRFDIDWKIPKACNVVYHITPKRGPQWAQLEPGLLRNDLKTSKDFYVTKHPRQLAAYEEGAVECGYPESDARGVLVVGGHVKNPDTGLWETREPYYKFVRSRARFEDFAAALLVYESNKWLQAEHSTKRMKEAK
jgi:hypothetical protein